MPLVLETAIDTTSLGRQNRLTPTGRKQEKLKFTANFPRIHDARWFDELKHAKIQAGDTDLEVKWDWFAMARACLPRELVQRVFRGLGEAAISIYDLSKYMTDMDSLLLEVGVSREQLLTPPTTELVRRLATDSLLAESPLFEIGYIYELVTEDSSPFTPEKIRSELTNKSGRFIQESLEFASTLTPSLQELRDGSSKELLGQYAISKRYLNTDELQIQEMILALGPKRIIDVGHSGATLVCQVRVEISKQLTEGLSLMGITPIRPIGDTEILAESAAIDHMQMADLAAGYAKDLYVAGNHNASTLCSSFKCVILNSKLVSV